ncbi:hypothetical protein [Flindersiella endophytica]
MTAPTPPPSQPSPYAAVTAPVAAPGKSWRGRLLAGLVGLVLGGLIVGAAWLATAGRAGDLDGSSDDVALPAKVGSYTRFADAKLNQQPNAKDTVKRINTWNAESAKRLSASYGGAAAAVETYSDDTYENAFTVYVVRATSPFPVFVRYEDPKVTQLARPQNEERRFGEVSCQVVNDPTQRGQRPGPESAHVIDCRRSLPGLTVDIVGPIGDVGTQPDRIAGLVDEVWSQVS